MLDALCVDTPVSDNPSGWQPPPDWGRERWVQDIADRAAEKAIARHNELLGISNLAEFRRNMDYLAGLRETDERRRDEGRKTTFTVIGGMILAAAGWIVSLAIWLFNGHK